MKIHNMKQGTPEWFAIRKGKMTASHASAIGTNGAGLKTYVTEIVSNFFSSEEPERITNKDMERGNELEPIAREMYELQKGIKVKEIGFAEYTEFSGASPDGLVSENGLPEIKCPNDKNHFKLILDGEKGINSSYIWQMQMQMLILEREWTDFISYNPNFKQSLVIFRIYVDPIKQEKLKMGIAAGTEMIKSLIKEYEAKI